MGAEGTDDRATPIGRRRPRRPRPSGPPPASRALLAAARHLFAAQGPADVSIRSIGDAAGCSHTLIAQHFGSKDGLAEVLTRQIGRELADIVEQAGLPGLLAAVRSDPDIGRLLVRCMLGELDGTALTGPDNVVQRLAGHLSAAVRGRSDAWRGNDAMTIAAYATAAMLFGLVTFEGLLRAGSNTESVPAEVIDAAIIDGAGVIATMTSDDPALAFGPMDPPAPPPTRTDLEQLDVPTALVLATIELYAQAGGAPLSTRAIAERAGVNQGLIYHYFDSREHLLSVAINQANQPLQQTAGSNQEIDYVALIRSQYQLSSLRIIARLLANGVPIREVRNDFPVFQRLLAMYDHHPDGPNTAGLTDPRLAVFTASAIGQGMSLWDGLLRRALDIPPTVDLVTPAARLAEKLLAQAAPTK